MIYVDHAATSFPKPEPVIAEVTRFLREEAANPGRGGYRLVRTAEAHMARVRGQLARFVGGRQPERMIFTYSATDGLNIAIKGVVRPGDRVVVDQLAHNSISRPLRHMADLGQIELVCLTPPTPDGALDPQQVADAVAAKPTRLVAIVHASNVLGTLEPIGAIGPIVRAAGALFLVDAAQSIGAADIDVERDCIDLLAFPGHKGLQGPPGTGGLWVGSRAVDTIAPAVREGGTGGDSAFPTQPPIWPHWLEAGTHNTAGVAGLGAALEWIEARGGPAAMLRHERELIRPLIDFLASDGRFTLYGPAADRMGDRIGLASFNIAGVAPADVAAILDADFDICVRAGLHCAPGAHRHVGSFPDGSVRVSVGPMNTPEEIAAVIGALKRIAG
ncbi:MAG: aminotransferase class V-fold PLP-dependent enzyme [Phycisphaerae bacterium]|nr:aminotransferase class V-fold PLP-dependent enzyme [Phycisphaerae bacterium]